MIAIAPAVCLLRVDNQFGTFGTGFRMSEKLVSPTTTYYSQRIPLRQECMDFGFDVDAAGSSVPVTSLPGTIDTIKGEGGQDDWAGGLSRTW